MRTGFESEAKKMTIKRKWHSRWVKAVTVLASVTVFCTTYALILPAITMSTDTYCGHEEHKHDESCYERQLICVLEEGAEKELEVVTEEVTVVTKEQVLVDAGHTHEEACYEEETVLICDIEEVEAKEAVVDEETGEVIEEAVEGHTHDESCYEVVETLVCEEEEREAVYEEQEVETVETIEKESVVEVAGHKHTDECYESVLVCTIEEHEHEDICFSNKEAVEEVSDWEKTLPEAKEMKENPSEDIVLVAASQVGYKESEENFVMVDGQRKGYTRYGAMFGKAYEDWNAMFVQFCMHYAGVNEKSMKGDTDISKWIEEAQKKEVFFAADAEGFQAKAGDIVFFEKKENDEKVYTVGIVEEVNEKRIIVIEGDDDNEVVRNKYDVEDKEIKGYAVLPEKAEEVEAVVIEETVAEVEEVEEVEEVAEETTKEAPIAPSTGEAQVVLGEGRAVATFYTDDTYSEVATEETSIVITGELPVVKVVNEETGEEVEELAVEVKAYKVDAPQIDETAAVFAYDITIFYKEGFAPEGSDGTFQPVTPVKVSFESALLDDETVQSYAIYHIADDGETEYCGGDNSEKEEGVVSFDAHHFSPYMVTILDNGTKNDTYGAYPEDGEDDDNSEEQTAVIEEVVSIKNTLKKALKLAGENTDYAIKNGDTYTVKSWKALEELIENGKYKDGSEIKNNAGNNLDIVIHGIIAANSQINTSGKTITINGTNNATIYVDANATKITNEMFWVNGGNFNVSNVVFSGKKATYTPGSGDGNCDLSYSQITVSNNKLSIGGVKLSKDGDYLGSNATYQLTIVDPSSGAEINSLDTSKEYYIYEASGASKAYLRTGNSDGKYWYKTNTPTDSTRMRWKLNSKGVLENVADSSIIIYRDSDGNISLKKTSELQGCDGSSGSNNGTWTVDNNSTIDSVVTANTKGFFIAADSGAKVKLNSGTVIQDMNYTGTTSNVSPIYVKGANTKLEINGAEIKNNHSTIPALQNEDRKLLYNDVLDHARVDKKDPSWDINPGGTDYRREHDTNNVSAGAIRIEGATVDFNSGTLGGENAGNTGIAGAVYIDGGTFNQYGGTINGNHALKGAVIVNGSNSTYNLKSGSLENNDSSIFGGAISVFDEGKVIVGDSTQGCDENSVPVIRGNKTLHQGGGIYVHSDNVTLNRARIENNIAHFMGGGIYVYGGDAKQNEKNSVLILDDTYITDNKAGNTHFTSSDGQFGFHDSWGDGNYGQGGGMWFCTYGSFVMDGNEIHIWGNEADDTAPDFYKHANGGSSGIITEFKPYVKNNTEFDKYKNISNGGSAFPPASFTPVTGRLALRNDADDAAYTSEMNGQCDSVRITGNRAGYAGGGIGSNGIISYKPLKNEEVYQPEFSFTKDFKEKDVNGNAISKTGKIATFNVKVYNLTTDPTASGEPAATYTGIELKNGASIVDDPNGVNSTGVKVQNWTAYVTLPQLFDANGVSIYKGIVANKPPTMTGDNDSSSYDIDSKIKIVIEEVSVTDGGQSVINAYELKLGTMGFTHTTNTIANNQQDLSITYHTVKLSTTLTNVTNKGRVQLTKKDKLSGNTITDGAVEFRISPVVDGTITDTVGTKIDGSNGVFTTADLAPGKYAIWESVAPTGYIGLGETNYIYVTIAANGTPSIDNPDAYPGYVAAGDVINATSTSTAILPIEVNNKPGVGLSIVKVDEDGEPVTGNTQFEIRHFGYGENGSVFTPISFTLSESNTYTINDIVTKFTEAGLSESNLESTRFYIVETNAHENGRYEKLKHVIPFKIVKTNGVYTFAVMDKAEVDAHPKGKDAGGTSFAQEGKTRSVIGISGREVYVEWTTDGGIDDVAVTDDQRGSITYTVTNHKKPGQLEIEKELQGAGAGNTYLYGSNNKFYFDVSFGGNAPSQVSYKIVAGTTVVNTGTFNSASGATIGIEPGQKIRFENLPIGTTYGVRESTKVTINGVDKYTGNGSDDAKEYSFVEYEKNGTKQPAQQADYITGVIEDPATIKVERVKAVNKENTGLIKLKKVLTGADDTTTKFNFEFKSTFNDADYTGYVVEKVAGGNTSSSTGNGAIELTHNEEVIIKNLPLGSTWTIEEKNIPSQYKLSGFSIDGTDATTTDNKVSGGPVSGLVAVNVIANNYKPLENKTPAYLILKGIKVLENGEEGALSNEYNGAFSFTIERVSPSNAPLPTETTVTNVGNAINFGMITFDRADTYIYKIKEVIPAEKDKLPGIAYSTAERIVRVVVGQKMNGNNLERYISSVQVDGQEMTLNNASQTVGGYNTYDETVTVRSTQYNILYNGRYDENGRLHGVIDPANYSDIRINGNNAYCLDDGWAAPTNSNYIEFDIEDGYSGFTYQPGDSEEKILKIKKLFYYGYPYDGGDGYFTDMMSQWILRSKPVNETIWPETIEAPGLVFRTATQAVLHALMANKSVEQVAAEYSYNNHLNTLINGLYEKIADPTTDYVADYVILQTYRLNSNNATSKQRVIIPVIAKSLKLVNIEAAFTNVVETVDVEIEKVNLEGDHENLPGAKFTLTDGEGNVTELTETSTGKFKATGIRKNAIYTLTETKAPNGFKGLGTDNPISFKVDSAGQIVLTDDNSATVISMVQASNADNTLKLVVSNKTYPSIKIKKVGDGRHDNPLSGAQFQLIVKEVNGISADTIFAGRTNGNGEVKDYVNVFDLNCDDSTKIGTTYNQKKYYVKLKNNTQGERKLDQYGFLIRKSDNSLILNANGNLVRWLPKEVDETNNMTFTSGADGIIDLGQLPTGKYELHEIASPAGHKLLENPITIIVSSNGVVTATGDMLNPGTDVTSSGNTYEIYVSNASGSTLPETGGIGTTIFTVIGALMIMLAAALLALRVRLARSTTK